MENKEDSLLITNTDAEQAMVPRASTPMNLIEMAVQKGADIGTIERLVALKERMEAKQAEMAFSDAMNKAQRNMGPVNADLENPQTRSRYASYWALDRRVRPIYTANGFSLSFDEGDSPKPEHVRVLCYVSHVAGHTRTYHKDIPADGKGAKGGDVMTKTHAAGAADSYGRRYLLKGIFNIAIGEEDTDGNSMNNGEVAEQCEWIENAMDMKELQTLYVAAYKKASEAKDKSAMAAFIASKDKRKKELQ